MSGTLRVDFAALAAGAEQVSQAASAVQGAAQGNGPVWLRTAAAMPGSAAGDALSQLVEPVSFVCVDVVEALLGLSRGMTRAAHDHARVDRAAAAAATAGTRPAAHGRAVML